MLELLKPQKKLVLSYLNFIDEMRNAGEKIWEENTIKPNESADQFVDRLLRLEKNAPPGMMNETQYWATKNGKVVGRIALRHALNENLKEFGGHIGYEVRPSSRKQGVATEMLRLLLETKKAKEIGQILLTCAPDNVASNKTIIANGGKLTKTAYVERWTRETNYYWIITEAK